MIGKEFHLNTIHDSEDDTEVRPEHINHEVHYLVPKHLEADCVKRRRVRKQ